MKLHDMYITGAGNIIEVADLGKDDVTFHRVGYFDTLDNYIETHDGFWARISRTLAEERIAVGEFEPALRLIGGLIVSESAYLNSKA